MAGILRENIKIGDFLNDTALVFWHVSRIQNICISTEKYGLVFDEHLSHNIVDIRLG